MNVSKNGIYKRTRNIGWGIKNDNFQNLVIKNAIILKKIVHSNLLEQILFFN